MDRSNLQIVLGLLVLAVATCSGFESPYHYLCERDPVNIGNRTVQNRCVRHEVKDGVQGRLLDLNGCKMTCGQYGTLWPRPSPGATVHLSGSLVDLCPDSFDHVWDVDGGAGVRALIDEFKPVFIEYLRRMHPRRGHPSTQGQDPFGSCSEEGVKVKVSIRVSDDHQGKVRGPDLSTDESYTLRVTSGSDSGELTAANLLQVAIEAKSYFGARHGLETLSQLVSYNELTGCLQAHEQALVDKDSPQYRHRGLMVDTSRNFMDLDTLKRVVDGLSFNKMNVLHWHLTDSHSFPLEVKSFPGLTRMGAYSADQVYSQDDIRDLVHYAAVRGVQVVPEFDAPAHVGEGWQFAERDHPEWGKLVLCLEQTLWDNYCVEPPCGQFNVVNEKLYEILEAIYTEMADLFSSDMFHFGGDEINFNCWNSSQEILDYLEANDLNGTPKDFLDIWKVFQDRALALVNKSRKRQAVIWTNSMTDHSPEEYLGKEDYIIQIWSSLEDPKVKELIKKGYRTIFSPNDRWYLDCGYAGWVTDGNNWCSPYKGWQLIYDTSPRRSVLALATKEGLNTDSILGGEACLWSEQVQGLVVDGKLWPRSAALGERLWADPETDWKEAEDRLLQMTERMVRRGIHADALQPEWCRRNEKLCRLNF